MLHRLTREPALILGVLTTGLSLAMLFGAPITIEQAGGVGVFVGSLMALIRFVTTPTSEVLAQVRADGEVVAGAASAAPTGAVLVDPAHPENVPINRLGEPVVSVPLHSAPDAEQ